MINCLLLASFWNIHVFKITFQKWNCICMLVILIDIANLPSSPSALISSCQSFADCWHSRMLWYGGSPWPTLSYSLTHGGTFHHTSKNSHILESSPQKTEQNDQTERINVGCGFHLQNRDPEGWHVIFWLEIVATSLTQSNCLYILVML